MFSDFLSQHQIGISMLFIALAIVATFLVSKYIIRLPEKLESCSTKEMKRRYIRVDILCAGIALASVLGYCYIHGIYVQYLCVAAFSMSFTFAFYYRQIIRDIKAGRKNASIYEDRPNIFE